MVTCEQCGAVFYEDDAMYRVPYLEDGLRPWEKVMICPWCRSDELRTLDDPDEAEETDE